MADKLQLLNTRLLKEIVLMSDEDLWLFVLKNMERAEELRRTHEGSTYLYLCLYNSFPYFRKRFFGELEYDFSRNELDYAFILDFCFEGERLKLDYYGIGGFYDYGDSCDVINSIEIMPPLEDDSDFHYQISFYLLGANHLEHIVEAMEKNVDKLTDDAPANLETIKAMHKKCLEDEGYNAAYIYYAD
jgi:hypothetical protein